MSGLTLDLALERLGSALGGQAGALLFSPSSTFSLYSLMSALVVAGAFILWKRRGKPTRLKVLARALFPRRWLVGPSARADLGLLVLNTFMAGVLFGGALLSTVAVKVAVAGTLPGHPLAATPGWLGSAITTVALFLAYEFAYWLDHALSHRVPFLWAFHKTHHTAKTLSPVTVFRVHPVDSIVFANIMALVIGAMAGVCAWLFGPRVEPFAVSGTNILLLGFTFTVVHLQHSEVWIAATGWLGRVLMSPAHHQIHHSTNPAHFDRNFGSCLSLFDWAFGTLHAPSRTPEKLTFGVEGAVAPHSVTGVLITPFVEALGSLVPGKRQTPSNSTLASRT